MPRGAQSDVYDHPIRIIILIKLTFIVVDLRKKFRSHYLINRNANTEQNKNNVVIENPGLE